MGRIIFITSFKGGVGKSTVSANLAASLAYYGKKVLLADGDFGMRCLDLVLGLENDYLFNSADVLNGLCQTGEAIINYKENFDFLPAPSEKSEKIIPSTKFFDLFKPLKNIYDYILIDSSAEESPYYLSFANVADDAFVVAHHTSVSIRAAEKTAYLLTETGFRSVRLIINNYSLDKKSIFPDIAEIIYRSAVKLIGVVPYDRNLAVNYEKGIPAFGGKNKRMHRYEAAFLNIAKRVSGERVPLFLQTKKPGKILK